MIVSVSSLVRISLYEIHLHLLAVALGLTDTSSSTLRLDEHPRFEPTMQWLPVRSFFLSDAFISRLWTLM